MSIVWVQVRFESILPLLASFPLAVPLVSSTFYPSYLPPFYCPSLNALYFFLLSIFLSRIQNTIQNKKNIVTINGSINLTMVRC